MHENRGETEVGEGTFMEYPPFKERPKPESPFGSVM